LASADAEDTFPVGAGRPLAQKAFGEAEFIRRTGRPPAEGFPAD
jgi:hypothetical protein